MAWPKGRPLTQKHRKNISRAMRRGGARVMSVAHHTSPYTTAEFVAKAQSKERRS